MAGLYQDLVAAGGALGGIGLAVAEALARRRVRGALWPAEKTPYSRCRPGSRTKRAKREAWPCLATSRIAVEPKRWWREPKRSSGRSRSSSTARGWCTTRSTGFSSAAVLDPENVAASVVYASSHPIVRSLRDPGRAPRQAG